MKFATFLKFQSLCTRVGMEKKGIEVIWEDLTRRYAEEHRAYHNLHHLEKMFGMMDESGSGSDAIELAIWFHDVIYDPRSKSNELLSADYFCNVAAGRIGSGLVADVRRLVLATDPSLPRTGEADEDLLIDIDLSILGSPKPAYEAYCAAVRKEYSFVDDESFAMGRAEILKRFLFGKIYATSFFQGVEENARINLEGEIQKLERALEC